LEHVLAILIGAGVIWLLREAYQRWHQQRAASTPAPPAPGPTSSSPTPSSPTTLSPTFPTPAPIDLAAPGTVSSKLHALDGQFSSFASDSAHPRELIENAPFKEAVALLADRSTPLETVMQYAQGLSWTLACAAFAALAQRDDRSQVVDRVMAQFDRIPPWPMYFALDYLMQVEPKPPVGAVVTGAKDWWRDSPIVPLLIQDYFTRRAGDPPEFGPSISASSASPPALIKGFLERVNHPIAAALRAQLDRIERLSINRAFLTTFGRFWGDENNADLLVEPDDWGAHLATAEATLRQEPARSLLISGERLVGKTTFLQLTACRLADAGWTVFEASGADIMAGQQWFGQLEGRIRETVDQLTVGKKVVWYIPDLLQLARSGTHQGQSASILDQILPAIVAGRLIVWTEATRTSVARLMQIRPALRGIFDIVEIEPRSEEATLTLAREVARRLSDETEFTIAPGCADVAVASARQYLSAGSLPGSAIQLLKLAAVRSERETIEPHDVLRTLSQLTGLPVSILDTRERIDLGSIRSFFTQRVIGQDEAVASIVERIAMLKAGLNDPSRPIGVFLFAGPTGTGKTELAKTTAEYLFGSTDRMIRLDMSEFQTPESTANILGSGMPGEPDSLISRVRKQPFSVVLLDEFEKAHPRIWDLFLQVFDDARLTDTLGQVADFRHCLIIMTTNLGATSHQTMGLGFAPAADAFTNEQVMRAISQTYRPEFQNRIDKIIVFQPFTRDLMRVILKKELNGVLERRGLKDRDWAVEWESTALEFLLEKGFSPAMGARPLKRAIEKYVIAPLAATIVERRFPEGDQFVFFRSDGRAIQAEFVDPDADDADAAQVTAGAAAPALSAMILTPEGTAVEFEALTDKANGIARSLASPEWESLKHSLAREMSSVDFWQRADRFEKLARLALMDRVAAAANTTDSLRMRAAKGARQPGQYHRELISRLALQVHLVAEGIRDVFEGSAIEVALMVEPALDGGASDGRATSAWCRQLLGMYRDWAENRHMQLSEVKTGSGADDLPILLVSGFGAERVLKRECGLHVLELSGSNGSSRASARVRLAAAPLGDVPAARFPRVLREAIDKASRPSAVVRRYRGEPSPLVRSADGSWRTGKLDAVLRGDFDLMAAE
jgi:ATP-dependent Clp protease ATP-binding subunit ClpC